MRPAIDFPGVADEIASGSTLIVCVCTDADSADVGIRSVGLQWLMREGTPAQILPFAELLQAGPHRPLPAADAPRSLFLVPDAWRGDSDAAIVTAWAHLNARRDALRAHLAECRGGAVLFVTEEVFRLIARRDVATDFLGLVQVEQADDESPATEPHEDDLVRDQRAVLAAMEARYGIGTPEFLRRLLARDTEAVSPEDAARWSAALSMLRKVDGGR